MPIRRPKPTSPGRRFLTYPDFAEVTKTEPEKSLVEGLKKSGGRNSNGRKTARHRGGGAKRLYRKIDFKRRKDGVPAKVAAIEYDPNRSAYIALLHYVDGEKRYILAPNRLRVGMTVSSGPGAEIAVGNSLPLRNMPVGTIVHNVELHAGRARGADRARERCARHRRRHGGGRLMDPSQVIIRPVVSEKSYVLAAADKYTFRVHPDAHKTQIRQAIEELFDVNVVDVRTASVKSKPKRRGHTAGRSRSWKKAVVELHPDDRIELFEGQEIGE